MHFAHPDAMREKEWSDWEVKLVLVPVTEVALRELDDATATPSTNAVQDTKEEDLVSTNW